MRFLVDTNLPRALCRFVAGKGHEAEHVLDLGLAQMPDIVLWRYATSSGACIITKDRDFITLARQSGPQVAEDRQRAQ
ncbi:MAG: DUF5615 family PIN-like protein [Alphaproteobacteria bacterium]|nr:DUF5615 family PIN-like protein [Alphaproteobacteria bacterium]